MRYWNALRPFAHHPCGEVRHERNAPCMYNPTVGFAATRPTSGRLRLSPRAVSRTSASPSQLRHCTASALRQRLSSIPPPHAFINIAGHPGLSIAIAATTPTASGHSAVSSIEARSTPASKAWWHPHIPVDDGRHRTTLNDKGPWRLPGDEQSQISAKAVRTLQPRSPFWTAWCCVMFFAVARPVGVRVAAHVFVTDPFTI